MHSQNIPIFGERRWEHNAQIQSADEAKKHTDILSRQLTLLQNNHSVANSTPRDYEIYLTQTCDMSEVVDVVEGLNENMSFGFNLISRDLDRIDGSIKLGFAASVLTDIALNSSLKRANRVNTEFLANVFTNELSLLRSEVVGSITALHADFNIGIGNLLHVNEMLREDVRNGFAQLDHTLKNERKTRAAESFRDGVTSYNTGCKENEGLWFQDAVELLEESVKLHRNNPLAYLILGHIYHYRADVRDFAKAIECYEKCAIYGKSIPESEYVAALGYFYASWLKAVIIGDFEKAIADATKSVVLCPDLGEAHYHLAKFHVVNGDISKAISCLKTAVAECDRNYIVKAAADPNFVSHSDSIEVLLKQLKAEASEKLVALADEHTAFLLKNSEEWSQSFMEEILADARRRDTYFDYLDAMKYIESSVTEIQIEKGVMQNELNEIEKKIIQHIEKVVGIHSVKIIRNEKNIDLLIKYQPLICMEEHYTNDVLVSTNNALSSGNAKYAFLFFEVLNDLNHLMCRVEGNFKEIQKIKKKAKKLEKNTEKIIGKCPEHFICKEYNVRLDKSFKGRKEIGKKY